MLYCQAIVVGKVPDGLLCRCVNYKTTIDTGQFRTLGQARTTQTSTVGEETAHAPILLQHYPGWQFIDVGKHLVSPLKVATTGFRLVGLVNYEICDLGTEYTPPPRKLTPQDVAKLEHDKARALRSLMKSATNGEAWAETSVGLRFLKGDGVPKDFQSATNWLWRATLQGDLEASNKLVSLTMPAKPVDDQ
jgi:hypothetical protein